MKFYCDTCKKNFAADISKEQKECACPDCGKSFVFHDESLCPGVVLGDFLIKNVIDKGGMGVVYLASQISLDRDVALKVLQNKHIEDKEYVESLYREARAAAKINHPNVVQAYAIGEDDGIFYFAMEYVRGDTFKKILKNRGGKLEFNEAAKVIRDVARALSAAWREQKLVHQDIKPDNIMLDANGFAKLADLGLARTASAVYDETDDSEEVLGTPQYISPEQLTGVPTDVRSDIYSLGATFYQFVTGRYAYIADSLDDLPRLHVEGNLEPPKNVNPELPDALNAIIVKMMARQPEKRYQTPDDLIADLEKFLSKSNAPAAPKIGGAVPKLNITLGAKSANAAPVAGKTAPKSAPAKAPLSLNLNGAKPAVSNVNPATPAAKPNVPAAAPAVTKLPAAAKSAAPAAPSAPPSGAAVVKPVVPAAPPSGAAVVKPVVPAAPPSGAAVVKPVVPAAPPSGAPSLTPVLTPSKPAVVKPAGQGDGVQVLSPAAVEVKPVPQTQPDAQNNGKAEKNSGENAEKIKTICAKTFKWSAIGLSILLVLAIAFVVTVMILAKKDKLPQFLEPVGNYLESKADDAKNKAIELAKPQDVTAKEEVPEGPVTRPEFIKAIEDIINFRMLNPQKGEEFLKMADAIYPTLESADTDEEKAAVQRLLNVYSPVDEKLRCNVERNKLRSAYQEILEAAAEKRAKIEAERLAQLEEQKRREAEAAELAARLDEQNRQAQIQRAQRLAQLEKDCLSHGKKLADAMLQSVITDDHSVLEKALAEVDHFIRLSVIQTAEEKAVFTKLTNFIAAMKKETEVLKVYKRRLGNIRKRHNLYITLGDKNVALVERITPEVIVCSTGDNDYQRQVSFHTLPESSRVSFINVISSRFKQLPNPGFFIPLLNRHVDALALKSCPKKGFWNDYWPYFKEVCGK